jgi:hypothetical protein
MEELIQDKPGSGGEEPDVPNQFSIIIVYGINKPLEVTKTETIENVKLGAMDLFGIPRSDGNQYVLRVKKHGEDVQLNEAETVAQADLHPHEKVTLASGTPFGA